VQEKIYNKEANQQQASAQAGSFYSSSICTHKTITQNLYNFLLRNTLHLQKSNSGLFLAFQLQSDDPNDNPKNSTGCAGSTNPKTKLIYFLFFFKSRGRALCQQLDFSPKNSTKNITPL